jgi:hypothetical protein
MGPEGEDDPRKFRTLEGKPLGSGRWNKAYVRHILTSPAAMGTYQPKRREGNRLIPDGDPIPNYYPAVVTAEEWHDAQEAIAQRAGDLHPTDPTENGEPVLDKNGKPLHRGAFVKGGKASPVAGRPSEANLFTKLVKCAETGAPLHIIHSLGPKAKNGKRKVYTYLAREHMTKPRIHFDYEVFERVLLSMLREIDPKEVAPAIDDASHWATEEARLSKELAGVDAGLVALKERWDRGHSPTILDMIEAEEARKERLLKELAAAQWGKEINPAAALPEARSLMDLLDKAREKAKKEPREEVRRKLVEDVRRPLKAALHRAVDSIHFLVMARGRDRLAYVQMDFRHPHRKAALPNYHGDPDATYASRRFKILHRPPLGNGNGRKVGRWWATSLLGGPDLTDPKVVKEVVEMETIAWQLERDGLTEDTLEDEFENALAFSPKNTKTGEVKAGE